MARIISIALLGAALGCGSEAKVTPAPPMKTNGGVVLEAMKPGDKLAGENPNGPKREDSDKKIAEIRANASLSEELKKQLIEEVERTYREAQQGPVKSK